VNQSIKEDEFRQSKAVFEMKYKKKEDKINEFKENQTELREYMRKQKNKKYNHTLRKKEKLDQKNETLLSNMDEVMNHQQMRAKS